MAEPMRPAIKIDIMTEPAPTNRDADHAADRAGQPRSTSNGPVWQRDDAADEKRKNADHQQAGVADLEELVEDFLALAPRQRNACSVCQNTSTSSRYFETYDQPFEAVLPSPI